MASFVNPDFPTQHRGLLRAENALASLQGVRSAFTGAKGLVAILVAGAVSALVVVADQIVNTWTDGDLFMAWVALWALVFAASALFAKAIGGWSLRLVAALEAWALARRERADDAHIWAVAQTDPRIMRDLEAACLRAEREALAAGDPLAQRPFASSWAARDSMQ